MLIGEIAKDTNITIYYDTPEGTKVYQTAAIEQGNTNMELVVKTIMTEDNTIAKFDKNFLIRIELKGSSNIGLRVDNIELHYNQGRTTHAIQSRSRIAIANKRETFRLPFSVECKAQVATNKTVIGRINDISFEGISILINIEDSTNIVQNSTIRIKFSWGVPIIDFDLYCKVMHTHNRDEKTCLVGCTLERNSTQIRNLIMHLQMEEARKKRNTYSMKK